MAATALPRRALPRASHGIHGLGCGPLFLAEGLDGFGDPGVGVLRQEDPAGCAVFQGSGDLLGPRHLLRGFQIGQHTGATPLSGRDGPGSVCGILP